MINILLVDDDPVKIRNIRNVLIETPDIKDENIIVAADIQSAKKALLENQFDLMILDLSLPEKFGEMPLSDGGFNFLEEISLDDTYKAPFHIIGLTAYEDLKETYAMSFKNYLWHIIHYEPEYETWKNQLANYTNYLIRSKSEIRNPSTARYNFDIGIITALTNTELENVLKLDGKWQEYKLKNDHTVYHKGVFENKEKQLSVIACSADQMGLTAASTLSQKVIFNFRPKYLIMSGIAAGVKNKGDFGDIMIADLTWDYGSGKLSTNKNGELEFKQDPRPIQIAPELNSIVKSECIQDTITETIQKKWKLGNGENFGNNLKVISGPIASGSYVIENIKKIQEVVDQQRKLIGIDMETYAVFFAATNSSEPRPKPMSIKSICDFGDKNKNDVFQNYAAFTSANYIYNFALKYL